MKVFIMLQKIFLGIFLFISLEIHPMFGSFIARNLYYKSTPLSKLNQQLLDAVVDSYKEKVYTLLRNGANPNSYQGNNGILSMAIYRINCAVHSNDLEFFDDSVQILKDLLSAGIDTKPTETYDCIQHVELISKHTRLQDPIYQKILELLQESRKK